MGQLAADAFCAGEYVDSFCDNYIGNSHYDWNVSRLVLDCERLVHHWGVWGHPMRLASTQLKVAGIGAVVTHPEYRKQGWMVRAAQASFDAMASGGYDLSILCLEAAGDPHQALAVLAELFKRGEYERLACFTLPTLHPLLKLLRKGACLVEDRYFDVSGWRVKLINLRSSLEKLTPPFEHRLAHSPFADWQGSLYLDGGQQAATLQIMQAKVRITDETPGENVLCAGPELARFLIGSDEPDEIIRQADINCSGLAQPLAQVLFPNLRPVMSHWDEY